MQFEYFLFNILVVILPLSFSFVPKFSFQRERNVLLFSALLIAIPFLIWDALVTNFHWYFNSQYTFLHIPFLPLPLEEMLFFITVPFASGVIWEIVFVRVKNFWISRIQKILLIVYGLIPILVALGVYFLMQGKGYTGLTAIALAIALLLDWGLGIRLMQQLHFYVFLLIYNVLNLLCNGYLTARPIVLYNPTTQLDIRITTIPVEDFFYGMALIIGVLSIYSFLLGRWKRESIFEYLIRKKLHNYKEIYTSSSHPIATQVSSGGANTKGENIRVAIVGAGLAGMSAAILLARKGISVDVYEAESFVGGKCGVWNSTISHESKKETQELEVEHGLHGIFSNYYNLIDFLDSLEIYNEQNFPYIENYCIIPQSKDEIIKITDSETTPLLNMWRLMTEDLQMKITPMQIIKLSMLFVFLTYDEKKIFQKYDGLSYKEFRDSIEMPHKLSLIFTTFSRAFFSTEEHLSTAELLRSFHFYYCSHNRGLLYRYFKGSYKDLLINPLIRTLEQCKGQVITNTPIGSIDITSDNDSKKRFTVNNTLYDDVIVCADVEASKRIITDSSHIETLAPTFYNNMKTMCAGQEYAVLTLWVEGQIECSQYPPFFTTDKITVLDAITIKERVDDQWNTWIKKYIPSGIGQVLELHCYSIEDAYSTLEDGGIVQLFLSDLTHYFPEFEHCTIHYKYLMRNKNFTAFHKDMHTQRPSTQTGIEGLYIAGDWVKLPFSAFLMEAAHTSGRLAANEICTRHGIEPYPVYMVPQKGVFS